jgi:tetraacyldisaccharide-1-P 4'-kinase
LDTPELKNVPELEPAHLAALAGLLATSPPSVEARALEAELLALCARGARREPLPAVLHAVLRASAASRGALAAQTVVGFSASASPDSFGKVLRAVVGGTGCVCAHYSYPDHAQLPDDELRWLLERARERGAQLVTTAKDAVRLPQWARAHVTTLDVRVEWERSSAARLASLLIHRRILPQPQAPSPAQ